MEEKKHFLKRAPGITEFYMPEMEGELRSIQSNFLISIKRGEVAYKVHRAHF